MNSEITDIGTLVAAMRRDHALHARKMLSFYRDAKLAESYTYGELLAQVDRRTAWLQAIGIKRGDRVAILSRNSPEVPLYTLALLQLGAATVPLNPQSPKSEWKYVLEHARVRGLLGTGQSLEAAEECGTPLEFRHDMSKLPLDGPAPKQIDGNFANDVATILYTSGTTAHSKGVILTQASIVYGAQAMAQHFGLHESTQLIVLPLYHAHAFTFGLMTALSSSGHLVLCERIDPLNWMEIVQREQVRSTSAFPGLLPLLSRAGVLSAKVPSLRWVMTTAAPLPREVARHFEQSTGLRLLNGWGMSECASVVSSTLPEQESNLHKQLLLDWEVPCIGSPLPGIEMDVLDPDGRPLGPNCKGELCVRGPAIMQGYFQDAAQTAHTLRGGYVHSGDEGFYVTHGDGQKSFFLTGRIKELIIRGGENISPLALEELVVAAAPDLYGKFVLLGFPHDVYGEEIGAYLETSNVSVDVDRLKNALASLPPKSRPKVIAHGRLPIPRTHTGKVQRRKLQGYFAAYASFVGGDHVVSLESPATS
jgi:long-chain acyl-CoA synthetase